MDEPIKIIGICLIKNEDLYIGRVIQNVVKFCDEIIVLDNMSEDNTYKIVEKLSRKYSHIKLQKIPDYKKSHSIVSPYAGTLTWFFRIDGDEIYDPVGLKKIQSEVKAGQYQKYWRLEGNSLNCIGLDLQNYTAKGYLSPPSKPAPMLYNFSVLQSWHDDHAERLHGKNLIFVDGVDKSDRLEIFEKYDWENSPFRCLHICFLKRSSLDKNFVRLNPNELSKFFSGAINIFRNLLSGKLSFESSYKLKKYKRGSLVSKNINNFFPKNHAE